MANVVFLTLTPLAGAPIRIANALNKYTDYNVRVINYDPACYGKRTFPEDLIWKNDKEECLEIIRNADILHFHHYMNLENEKNPFEVNFKTLAPKAKIIRHFHSEINLVLRYAKYITYNDILNDKYTHFVIPHCAERSFLHAYVVPNIIPVNDELLMPKITDNDKVSVFFSSTTDNTLSMWDNHWNTKGVPEIIAKMEKICQKENFNFIHVSDVPYAECQKIKQNSDIVLGDITTGSYHLTDLEALSQGKATFSYLDSRTQLTLTNLLGCKDLPFINTRLEEIDSPLREIIKDKELRTQIGEFSRNWIEKYYQEKDLVTIYTVAYEKILNDEPICRQENLLFPKAKAFLYNRLYDLQWNARKYNDLRYDKLCKEEEELNNYLKSINFEKQFKKIIKTLKDKKIILYGTGKLFKVIYEKYNLNNLNIIGISDKKFTKESAKTTYFGHKIIIPNKIVKHKPDCILVCAKNYENLLPTLKELSGKNTNIIIKPFAQKPYN